VVLPPAYLELRDSAWRLQLADARARTIEETLAGRTAAPLWLVLVGNDLAFLLWVAAAPFVGVRASRALATGLQVDLSTWTSGERGALFAAAAFLFATAMSLLVLPLRSNEARQHLQASLAARPPDVPGGPSRCRQCGAILGVVPGRALARCPYCLADNFVAIEADAASRRTEGTAKAAAWVDVAEGELRSERWRFWTLLRVRLMIAATVCLGFWMIYALAYDQGAGPLKLGR